MKVSGYHETSGLWGCGAGHVSVLDPGSFEVELSKDKVSEHVSKRQHNFETNPCGWGCVVPSGQETDADVRPWSDVALDVDSDTGEGSLASTAGGQREPCTPETYGRDVSSYFPLNQSIVEQFPCAAIFKALFITAHIAASSMALNAMA